jgi:hypothetical protein
LCTHLSGSILLHGVIVNLGASADSSQYYYGSSIGRKPAGLLVVVDASGEPVCPRRLVTRGVGLFVGSTTIGVVVGAIVGSAAGFLVELFAGLLVGEILVVVGCKLEMVIDGALVVVALVGALVGSMLGPAGVVPLGPAVGEPVDLKVGAAVSL